MYHIRMLSEWWIKDIEHYLPLRAAAAAQSQHMLPALFAGLIYSMELRWMTESSSVSWFRIRYSKQELFPPDLSAQWKFKETLWKQRWCDAHGRRSPFPSQVSSSVQPSAGTCESLTVWTKTTMKKLRQDDAPTCSLCFCSSCSILLFLTASCSRRSRKAESQWRRETGCMEVRRQRHCSVTRQVDKGGEGWLMQGNKK